MAEWWAIVPRQSSIAAYCSRAGSPSSRSACGLGDLGTLFPPEEEQWRAADSFDLLEIAIGRLTGRPVNVDATVICEAPRLGDHRPEMERNLSNALSAPVSVKATTNEGMGALGRGEGIACMAVALVET